MMRKNFFIFISALLIPMLAHAQTDVATYHADRQQLICYHANGRRCSNSPFQAIDWSVACINHYVTKSIEEYCTNKLKRGVGDRNYELFLYTYSKRFFMYNEKTPEKEEWLKEHGIQGI